ncbi:unnamed protein product [Paramecium pentaurelia]|uniref:glutamine synthetase n=1 Tax=Paramecium pentaurelia TaxID=43138 RepID=A0A8S1UL91_9CILI|nr:unnamed protein product [Paramecium pentaurelia]
MNCNIFGENFYALQKILLPYIKLYDGKHTNQNLKHQHFLILDGLLKKKFKKQEIASLGLAFNKNILRQREQQQSIYGLLDGQLKVFLIHKEDNIFQQENVTILEEPYLKLINQLFCLLVQSQFQIGIAHRIEAGDHLWLARYILKRLGEELEIDRNYDPKPIQGDQNSTGAHCNFSTTKTREQGGYEYIKEIMLPLLEKNHQNMMSLYGLNDEARLTGKHETGEYSQFSRVDGSRGCSIRVPIITKELGKGYLEDRRPAANMDPHLVCSAFVDTKCMNGKNLMTLIEQFAES